MKTFEVLVKVLEPVVKVRRVEAHNCDEAVEKVAIEFKERFIETEDCYEIIKK